MTATYSYSRLSDLFKKDLDRIDEFKKIPDDLITLKPDPSTWSASETLQHIMKFNDLYLKQMEQAVQAGNLAKAQKGEFKPRFIYQQFIRFLEPPYKVKVKTFAPMYPNNTEREHPKQSIEELAEINKNFITLIQDFSKKQWDLDRIKGKNPIIQWIPMSLSEFLLVLEAHQRRHFWQIEQTLLKLSGEKY